MSSTKLPRRPVEVDGGLLMALYLSTLVTGKKIGQGSYANYIAGETAPNCAIGHLRYVANEDALESLRNETTPLGRAIASQSDSGDSCLEDVNDRAVKRRKKGKLNFEQWISAIEHTYDVELIPV